MIKKGPMIKAGAVAHATLVTRDDLKSVKGAFDDGLCW